MKLEIETLKNAVYDLVLCLSCLYFPEYMHPITEG